MPNILVGTITPSAPTKAIVGLVSDTVLAANINRVGLIIVNAQSGTISLGLNGETAVLNQGITLSPSGDWSMDDYTFTNGAITGIAYASGYIAIQEFVR